jgi:hypothetical protein
MKIKIILVVFILIIASSFVFTILSSRTTTNNNKVYFIETFIKDVCNHDLPLGKIASTYYLNGGKAQPAKARLSLPYLDSLRSKIGQAYPKDFTVTQYHDLPETEQNLSLAPDTLDNLFIVKQHHKKLLNILMNETKITSLNP